MPAWNFATLVDAIARATPDREVVVHGTRRITWQQLASRARSLAWHLQAECGLVAADKVTIVLPNCIEYVETFLATRKLHGVPLGVDPASGADALHAAIDGSDARVVVCAPATAPTVHTAIRRIPKRWRPTVVEIGPQYEHGIAAATPPADWEIEIPTADDLIAIATLDASAATVDRAVTLLPVAPLAQGDGFAELLGVLSNKGRAVFVDSPVFDPDLVWRTVEQEGVAALTINGDEFARPLLAALPGRPRRHRADEAADDQVVRRAAESRRRHRARDHASRRRDSRPDRGVRAARGGGGEPDRPGRRRRPAAEAPERRGLCRPGDLGPPGREGRGRDRAGHRESPSRCAGAGGVVPGPRSRHA